MKHKHLTEIKYGESNFSDRSTDGVGDNESENPDFLELRNKKKKKKKKKENSNMKTLHTLNGKEKTYFLVKRQMMGRINQKNLSF